MKGYNLKVIQRLATEEFLVRMMDTSRYPPGDLGYDLILGIQLPSFNPQINPYQYMKPPFQMQRPLQSVNTGNFFFIFSLFPLLVMMVQMDLNFFIVKLTGNKTAT